MLNQILDQRYRVVKVLSITAAGSVCLAVDTQNPDYAVRVVRQVRLPSRANGMAPRLQKMLNGKEAMLKQLAQTHASPAVLDFFLENQSFYFIEEFAANSVPTKTENQETIDDQGVQRLQEMLGMIEPVRSPATQTKPAEEATATSEPQKPQPEEPQTETNGHTDPEPVVEAENLAVNGRQAETPDHSPETTVDAKKNQPEERPVVKVASPLPNLNRPKYLLAGAGAILAGMLLSFGLWRYQEYRNTVAAITLRDQGLQSLEKKDYTAAISAFSQALQLDPKNPTIYGSRGNAYYDAGDFAAAIADYSKVIELQPGNTSAYYNRGLVYFDQGNYQAAINDLSIALQVQPHDADVLYKRGVSYYQVKNHQAAIADFDKLIRLNPKDDRAWSARGLALVGQKEEQKAMDNYTQAINLNPKDSKTFYNRGRLRAQIGDNTGALQDYNQALAITPQDVDALTNRCSVNIALNNHPDAVSDCTAAINLQPNNAVAFNNRCIAHFNRREHQNAIRDCTQALRLNPSSDQAYSNRGDVRRDVGDRTGALADYSEAIKINPNNSFTYTSRANVRRDLEDWRGAIDDYSRALALNPNNAAALYGRGLAYSRISGSRDQALDDLQRAAKIFLDNGQINAYQEAVAQGNRIRVAPPPSPN